MTLGQFIRQQRIATGRTQLETAEAIGISPSYLNDIEWDHRVPSMAVAVRIYQVLDIPPDVIYFYLGRLAPDMAQPASNEQIIAAYAAFRAALKGA